MLPQCGTAGEQGERCRCTVGGVNRSETTAYHGWRQTAQIEPPRDSVHFSVPVKSGRGLRISSSLVDLHCRTCTSNLASPRSTSRCPCDGGLSSLLLQLLHVASPTTRVLFRSRPSPCSPTRFASHEKCVFFLGISILQSLVAEIESTAALHLLFKFCDIALATRSSKANQLRPYDGGTFGQLFPEVSASPFGLSQSCWS